MMLSRSGYASRHAGISSRQRSAQRRGGLIERGPPRLTDLGATLTGALSQDGLDHYAMGMKDPEGNEFDPS